MDAALIRSGWSALAQVQLHCRPSPRINPPGHGCQAILPLELRQRLLCVGANPVINRDWDRVGQPGVSMAGEEPLDARDRGENAGTHRLLGLEVGYLAKALGERVRMTVADLVRDGIGSRSRWLCRRDNRWRWLGNDWC